jgi:hypothetical protein
MTSFSATFTVPPTLYTGPSRPSNFSGAVTVRQIYIESGKFGTKTLSHVTGKKGSISKMTTTGQNGLATVLPIWFGLAGLAILVVPLDIFGAAGMVPPPLGFPPVEIGPDGEPTEVNNDNEDDPDEGDPDEDDPATAESKTTETTAPETATGTTTETTTSSSTARSPAPTPSGYVIMPEEMAAKEELDTYTAELEARYGPNNIETTLSIRSTVLFWYARLAPD